MRNDVKGQQGGWKAWKAAGMAALLGLVALMQGCANTQAFVVLSPAYIHAGVHRVAAIDFTDYPGVPGSGKVAAGIFQKYLLLAGYSLMERSQVDAILKEQSFEASGNVDPTTVRKIGKLLGVDALLLGDVSAYSDAYDHTIFVHPPLEQSSPVYGQVTTQQTNGNTTVTTTQNVVTGYNYTQTDQVVPSVETVPAHAGLNVRLVDVETGQVLWSASGSAEDNHLNDALEEASAQIMQGVTRQIMKQP